MTIRLEEMHPALVHMPIVLLPLAVGADWLGTTRDDDSLREIGRTAIRLAAIGVLASAATGLVAGEEVNAEHEAHDMLTTHRNLNFAATVTTVAMAAWRSRNERPNATYLAAGAAAVGVVSFTAYLGAKLVYQAGVAVQPARGVYRPGAPTLRPGRLRAFAAAAAIDLVNGIRHMFDEVSNGRIVPYLSSPRGVSSPRAFRDEPPRPLRAGARRFRS